MAGTLKIAKAGKDISSTDPRDFSLSTDYYLFKIITEVILQEVFTYGTTFDDTVYINEEGWLLLFVRDTAGGSWKLGAYVFDQFGGSKWFYQNQTGSTVDISYFLTVDDFVA